MTGKLRFDWQLLGLRAMAMAVGLALFLGQSVIPVTAAGGDRTLWLHYTHTGQTAKFTYKRNGKFDPKVLDDLNVFLADWRTKSKAKMDPALFDLMWEVYQEVGAKQPYNIVSSYRDPKTNAMLRAKSSGVAENSQHMLGKAMDVFIPGVKLSTLRAAAMRHQVGGVGYYPTSGSPFVHMDTGSVRAWPRMTRAQLKTVFPDGRTLHLPVDGKPLSNEGRAYAQAQWNKCKMVPCNGAPAPMAVDPQPEVMLASLDPAQRSASGLDLAPPTPMSRRPGVTSTLALDPANNPFTAPSNPFNNPSAPLPLVLPRSKSTAMMVATLGNLPAVGETALGAIATVDTAPVPRILMTARDEDVVTAYAPERGAGDPAQRKLEQLIEGASAALTAPATKGLIDAPALRTAALGGSLAAVGNIFDTTWSAVTEAGSKSAIANTLVSASLDRDPLVGLKPRHFDLVAPEIDHVNETLVMPVAMSDRHFAELYEPEGYLDNAAELGALAGRLTLEPDGFAPPRYDAFVLAKPLLVASR